MPADPAAVAAMSGGQLLNAYIVGCVRTAGGKKGGSLSGYHPAELGAAVIDELLDRTRADPAQVEDVIMGCVSAVGAQAANVARSCVIASKRLPETCPGTTVDRQCASGQQAISFASALVMSGVHDCLIAGGVENMSLVPIGANILDGAKAGHGNFMSPAAVDKYAERLQAYAEFGLDTKSFSQFGGAELIGKRQGFTREDCDRFGIMSQERAIAATKAGKFKDEILPMPIKVLKGESPPGLLTVDEGIRPPSYEKFSKLKPMFPNGMLTPATSSQLTDCAAAVLICNERGLQRLGLKPRARIHTIDVAAIDPVLMLDGPVPATLKCLRKAGLRVEDIDLFEMNEAFATVTLSWLKQTGADISKVNVNGGAIALGHPLGATGARLATTLVHELERRKARYGLITICQMGGTATATIIERVQDSKL